MPLRAQVGGLAATLAVLCGLLVAMIAVGARGPAPSALWNAAADDSVRLRSHALGDLDDAEVRETAPLPVPGCTVSSGRTQTTSATTRARM